MLLVPLALLAACAGSPAAVANAPGGVRVVRGDDTVVVSKQDGVWAAAFADSFAKQIFATNATMLQRKVKLVSAIEEVSGCRVVESTIDTMHSVMHASVKCP